MSVVDMFVARPWDGVVPDPYAAPGILIQDLVPGSGAEKAGVRPGDVILGIGHRMLARPADAPPELRRHGVGESVRYLVKRSDQVFEVTVVLSEYRAASFSYFYFAFLGTLFVTLGWFVYSRRPDDPAASVFFLLCTLFLLFFVCRLRPLSYYWIDYFVQLAGTFALFLLPAVFLHFFLLFPSRKDLRFAEGVAGRGGAFLAALEHFLNGSPLFLVLLYTLPPATYVAQMAAYAGSGRPERLVYGAPLLSWILLADYLVLGILALFHSWWTAPERRQRQQILVLLVGTLSGTVPFVLVVFWFPAFFKSDRLLAWGVAPMALVPLSFAYAIVRFRLFDVRVIVKKSIVYALVTAAVTGFYALAVVTGSRLAASYSYFSSPLFAFSFALLVVLIVDPLRRRIQEFVDRRFFRDRADFQRALVEMSRSVVSQLEREKLHELLTRRTAELLRLERLVLLTPRPEDGALAAPPSPGGPLVLPLGSRLGLLLVERGDPVRMSELTPVRLDDASRLFRDAAEEQGVRVLVPVVTRGRLLGLLAVGAKRSEEEFGPEDLDHLTTIANQGALGLEAAALHEELTRRAEVERDLEIARDIQVSLFPRELPKLSGFAFYGVSRPAKVVGGDFYDFLPFEGDGKLGLVLGDVSGKSIPASLLMVAAKEIVYARAMSNPDPAVVFREANRRIYAIKRRMFVALSYFVIDPEALTLHYTAGGQPPPLLVRGEAGAVEIPSPDVRLPLGALRDTVYDARTFYLRRGDLLLFHTDGLGEAMSAEQVPYGDERLKASLVRHADRPLAELADELLEDIRQFTYGAEQYDDQTFVLMRVEGGETSPRRGRINLGGTAE
jgi:serine phosphatase RsbU (regulator of sigma subunit)